MGAISNFVPWYQSAKFDIFDIIRRGSIQTFASLRFSPRIALGAQAKSEVSRHQNQSYRYTPRRGLREPAGVRLQHAGVREEGAGGPEDPRQRLQVEVRPRLVVGPLGVAWYVKDFSKTNRMSVPPRFLQGQRTFSGIERIPLTGLTTFRPFSKKPKSGHRRAGVYRNFSRTFGFLRRLKRKMPLGPEAK